MTRHVHSRSERFIASPRRIQIAIAGTRAALAGPLIRNAASLYGSTVITSFLGFFYWFIAARMVPARAVGIASAVQSAAQLLATFCVLGLSTLMISELSRDQSQARSFMLTAAILVGLVSAVAAGVVSFVVHSFTSTVTSGLATPVGTLVFILLSVFTTILLVLDDACIGLLRGDLQLVRNTVFAISKLLLLPLLVLVWATRSGTELVVAWLGGLTISLITLVFKLGQLTHGQTSGPDFRVLFGKRRLMVGHHWLNISLAVPWFALPILVATLVSPKANASYTVAMLVTNFVNIISIHLATVLFALKPGDESALRHEVKKTMRICLVLALASAPFFIVFSRLILSIFGRSYVSATTALAILGFTTFPIAVKALFVSISRVRGRMAQAGISTLIGACLEVGLAAVGAVKYGITGVAGGFLAALLIEVTAYGPVVFGVLRSPPPKHRLTGYRATTTLE
jgi:O-antigen/teichoic acid export membrane protein